MKKTFKVKEICQSCKGTGIYSGMEENDGFGVVCHTCKGTGCLEFTHTYEEFVERIDRDDIIQVLQTNPGISVGISSTKLLHQGSFGGMPYEDWKEHGVFPPGQEMRAFTCPAWWYQSTNYKKKPNWKECIGIGSFSSCPSFSNKHQCWKRFDQEQYIK